MCGDPPAGSFGLSNATGWSVEEYAKNMDAFDWTEGLFIRTQRVKGMGESECPVNNYAGECYPELPLASKGAPGSQVTAPFGDTAIGSACGPNLPRSDRVRPATDCVLRRGGLAVLALAPKAHVPTSGMRHSQVQMCHAPL